MPTATPLQSAHSTLPKRLRAKPVSSAIAESLYGVCLAVSLSATNVYATAGDGSAAGSVGAVLKTSAVSPINSQCGAANGVLSLTKPTQLTDLCSAGYFPGNVISSVSSFDWTCGGGPSIAPPVNCSAPRGYAVTPGADANGALSCGAGNGNVVAVAAFGTANCVATPDTGYRTLSISGCGGAPTDAGVNSYTAANVVADCIVTATFEAVIDGTCGTANALASYVAPSGNALCSVGWASNVITSVSSFDWNCNSPTGNGINAVCSAPRQYMVTPSAGANGSLSPDTAQTVNANTTVNFTATPANGYRTLSISGCGGVATPAGTNSYTTGNVVADCTVTATFEPVVNGACGAANTLATYTLPSANLCSVGSASNVLSSVNTFDWSCAGTGGGTNAACSAPRQYKVTPSAGANGSLGPGTAQTVNANTTVNFTATPASGYRTLSISGCGGVATPAGTNSYTTGNVVADCAVTASFEQVINANCGTANGVATLVAPAANLCGPGLPGNVISSAGRFDWSCNGAGGGSTVSCSAPRQYSVTPSAGPNGSLNCGLGDGNVVSTVYNTAATCTATPQSGYRTTSMSGCGGVATGLGVNSYSTGNVVANCTVAASFDILPLGNSGQSGPPFSAQTVPSTGTAAGVASASFVSANGGPTCRFDAANTAFVAAPASYPINGLSLPHGMFKFKMIGCAPGFTARITVNWPSLAGLATYVKYGRTTTASAYIFYAPSNLGINGNSASFDVTDGGLGDDDFSVNGEVIDPSGPVVGTATEATPVPTLQDKMLAFLLGALGLAGLALVRRGKRAPMSRT